MLNLTSSGHGLTPSPLSMLESSQALEGPSVPELISKVSQWLRVTTNLRSLEAFTDTLNRMEHNELFKAIKTYAAFRLRCSFATKRPQANHRSS